MNSEEESLESLRKKLDTIIILLFELTRKGEKELSVRDKINKLGSLGLSNQEIAKVVGRTANHVRKELSLNRHKRKRRI